MQITRSFTAAITIRHDPQNRVNSIDLGDELREFLKSKFGSETLVDTFSGLLIDMTWQSEGVCKAVVAHRDAIEAFETHRRQQA